MKQQLVSNQQMEEREQTSNQMMKAKRNADYLAMLDKSMAEAESGVFITKTLTELEE